jgi:hypothetical protein
VSPQRPGASTLAPGRRSAMAKERDTIKEPWERLMERLYELSRRSGEEFERLFTDEELLVYNEEECFVGDEPPIKK